MFLVVKTGADHNEPIDPAAALVQLWVLENGRWSHYTHSTVADNMTRPIVVVDRDNGLLRVFATHTTDGGTIYEKTVPLAGPYSFTEGKGTPFIQLASDTHTNNATTTKQNVTRGSGLLVLASDQVTGYYAHNSASVPVPDPTASFTAEPVDGVNPLEVAFTNTSTSATGYSWDFGDGERSALASPGSHTYDEPGEYTVTLTATNRSGASSTATDTVTVARAGGPTVAMSSPSRTYTTSRWVGAAWKASSTGLPAVSYEVRRSEATQEAGFTSYQPWRTAATSTSAGFRGVPGETYCFKARGTDRFGNTGPWSAVRCTAVPLDERSMAVAGSWRKAASAGSYLGTVMRSTAKGAALAEVISAKRIGLVVTKAPGSGKVAVYRGRTLVKRISPGVRLGAQAGVRAGGHLRASDPRILPRRGPVLGQAGGRRRPRREQEIEPGAPGTSDRQRRRNPPATGLGTQEPEGGAAGSRPGAACVTRTRSGVELSGPAP